jgi:hypothetical protein
LAVLRRFAKIENRKMIIYEVTVKVRADLAEDFEKYMRENHISEVLESGFFRGARFLRSGENLYRTQYEAEDRQVLDEYLETSAGRLREDFLAHFPSGVEVSRENWEILKVWSEQSANL